MKRKHARSSRFSKTPQDVRLEERGGLLYRIDQLELLGKHSHKTCYRHLSPESHQWLQADYVVACRLIVGLAIAEMYAVIVI
jgi:hypothetical protein